MLTQAWVELLGGKWTRLHCSDWAQEQSGSSWGGSEAEGNTSLSCMSQNKIVPSTQKHQVSPVWVVYLCNVFYTTCLFVKFVLGLRGVKGLKGETTTTTTTTAPWYFSSTINQPPMLQQLFWAKRVFHTETNVLWWVNYATTVWEVSGTLNDRVNLTGAEVPHQKTSRWNEGSLTLNKSNEHAWLGVPVWISAATKKKKKNSSNPVRNLP